MGGNVGDPGRVSMTSSPPNDEPLKRLLGLLRRKQKIQTKRPNANAAEATPATAIPAIWGLVSTGLVVGAGLVDARDATTLVDEECGCVGDDEMEVGDSRDSGKDAVAIEVGRMLVDRPENEADMREGVGDGNTVLSGVVIVCVRVLVSEAAVATEKRVAVSVP